MRCPICGAELCQHPGIVWCPNENDERHRPANAGVTLEETAKALELLVKQEIPATEIKSRLRRLLEQIEVTP